MSRAPWLTFPERTAQERRSYDYIDREWISDGLRAGHYIVTARNKSAGRALHCRPQQDAINLSLRNSCSITQRSSELRAAAPGTSNWPSKEYVSLLRYLLTAGFTSRSSSFCSSSPSPFRRRGEIGRGLGALSADAEQQQCEAGSLPWRWAPVTGPYGRGWRGYVAR